MYILAKLVFKSYMPKQLEKGMWFTRYHKKAIYGKVYDYMTIYELKDVPRDMDSYISINGAPVLPYIIQPMRNADDVEEILVHPEHIGWWEYDGGTQVDDDGNWIPNIMLEDLSPGYINDWLYGENGDNTGLIALEVDDETREPLLYEGKAILKQADYVTEGEEEEEDDYEDMDWEDDEPEEDSAGFTENDRQPRSHFVTNEEADFDALMEREYKKHKHSDDKCVKHDADHDTE